ncbi:hypothetical protein [Roseomonas populi]|uniref:Uncharacterized protein n=1 Tax=Roseomonas populi TaxID=3121582 RepID=A0ABT1WZI2_9PROT|nr:hypothetical protein [Roseomonas pecuniae]MCR0981262.1 hypothetical protein [Roseomonas pecuniae]
MSNRALAVIALAGLASFAAPQARAEDSLFGNLFGRLGASEEVKAQASPELRDRERETRNLRREYWERERARLAQNAGAPRGSLATEASNRSLAAR